MVSNHKHLKLVGLAQLLCLGSLVFASSPSYATYYGGAYYNHHYGHYAYPYHRAYYNYHYGHHQRYHAHYGVHAHLNETAAYVVLGVLGAVLLTHLFTNDEQQYQNAYPKTYANVPPIKVIMPASVHYQTPVIKTVYHYNKYEGWEQLANDKADYALDIFAVQSQQDLDSGEPKIGFSLAAATIGDKQRAIRAMRKAIRIDANALNRINIHTLQPAIKKLSEYYQSTMYDDSVDADTAFMLATLSYLQQDYEASKSIIAINDQSQSANNLRELLKNKL